MDKELSERFRKILNQRLEDLLNEAEKTVSGMTEEKAINFPDPTDRASLESERNFQLRIRDRERKLIQKIHEAIERIDKGTFGICDECGEEIQLERLLARPVTTYCVECKERLEAEERARQGKRHETSRMTVYRHA